MISYYDTPNSLGAWDVIFFLLTARRVKESDVWAASTSNQSERMPEFHNVHMLLVFQGIESVLSPHSLDVQYEANSLDSHLIIEGSSISTIEEYSAICSELKCAGKINVSQFKLMMGETPVRNYAHMHESGPIAPFSKLPLGSRFKYLDNTVPGVWVKLAGDGCIAEWDDSQIDTNWVGQKVVSLNEAGDTHIPVQVVA